MICNDERYSVKTKFGTTIIMKGIFLKAAIRDDASLVISWSKA